MNSAGVTRRVLERRNRRGQAGGIDRRVFLQAGGATGALFALGQLGSLSGALASPAGSTQAVPGPGRFGALLEPDANGMMLPPGFTSRIVARQGQRVGGSDYAWHGDPDGGAVFSLPDGGWVYTSNEENLPGGAGAIRFDPEGNIAGGYRILSGTVGNCAGGPTPWGTWLSCEEHPLGEVWECQVGGPGLGLPKPLLGVFTHEAVAVDPVDHRLYLTEDTGGDDLPDRLAWGRFYRFSPTLWRDDGVGVLDLGVLEAMVVAGDPYESEGPWDVSWRLVDPVATTAASRLVGATPFDGGEGCWYDGGRVYFTTKGDNRVWALDVAAQRLEVLYDAELLGDDAPLTGVDNTTVSPFGDLFVAEDGGNMELVVLSEIDGALQVTPFLRLTGHEGSELAGPAFHAEGTRLYVSSQRGGPGLPRGVTFEIRGPFVGPAATTPPASPAPAVPTDAGTAAPGASSPRLRSLVPAAGNGGGPATWAAAALGAGAAAVAGWRTRTPTDAAHD